MQASIRPGRLSGGLDVPGSKSHTIRAILIAALADGESRLVRPLDSADARSCIEAARRLGARIRERGRDLLVRGTAGRPRIPDGVVDVGNSGTTLYFAAAIAALADQPIAFTGDSQIQARPAGNLLKSLEDLGARVSVRGNNGCAPFSVQGPLKGGRTVIACPTSQYLSSLLLAAPLAAGGSEIEVSLLNERPYVEMTLRWLAETGIRLERRGLEYYSIPGRQAYASFERVIPADFSSAAFFLCAAAVTRSRLVLRGLDMADSQGDKEVVGILERMGCRVSIDGLQLAIEGGPLRGIEVDMNAIPDALPALAAAACYAEGETRLVNVAQARLKETDRLKVMAAELAKMGADIEELPDGLVVRGKAAGSPLKGALVDGRGDHRVVMALAVAGLAADGETVIDSAEAAAVTYPGFFETLVNLGISARIGGRTP